MLRWVGCMVRGQGGGHQVGREGACGARAGLPRLSCAMAYTVLGFLLIQRDALSEGDTCVAASSSGVCAQWRLTLRAHVLQSREEEEEEDILGTLSALSDSRRFGTNS
jgi:hypothetical protein